MIMETERNEFDVRMPLITYSGKKALVCVNEEVVTYPAMEGTVERTAYIYDTLWVYCDTNDEESVRKSLVRELEKSIKECERIYPCRQEDVAFQGNACRSDEQHQH